MNILDSWQGSRPITLAQARELARTTLSSERLHHTACVAKAAVALAARYGADPARAELAAWLHDILKERDPADLLQCLRDNAIINDTNIERLPSLWHAYAGGIFVSEALGLDSEIANAVRYHTAGRAGMTTLEKVIFLADYISEDRDFRGAEEVRALADTSLDNACLMALRNGIIHICRMGKPLDLHSTAAYNDLIDSGSSF